MILWTRYAGTVFLSLCIAIAPAAAAPHVVAITPLGYASTSQFQVAIDFSEPLDPTTAKDVANYTMSKGQVGLPITTVDYDTTGGGPSGNLKSATRGAGALWYV